MAEKESKTGRYVWDGGELVKVSDRPPQIASRTEGVYFRKPYYETFNGREAVWVESKGQKKAEMKARGISEYNDFHKNPEQTEKQGTIYSYTGQPARNQVTKIKKPIPQNIQAIVDRKAKLNSF